MSLPIQVPVKPYVYKVLTHVNFFGKDSFQLSQTDAFGNLVYRSMTAVPLDFEEDSTVLPDWFSDQSAHYVLTIKPTFSVPDLAYNSHNLLTLSTLFEELVKNSFIMFISGRMDKFPAEKESIRRFCSIYEITEEDLKLATIKKQVQRFRWRSDLKQKRKKV